MMMKDVELFFRGQSVKVKEFKVEYQSEPFTTSPYQHRFGLPSMFQELSSIANSCSPKITVEGLLEEVIKVKGNDMSQLITIPSKLRKVLNENYKAFYELGYIDNNLELTTCGRMALGDFLTEKFENEFGEFAKKKIEEVKPKEEKKEVTA
jgi:hypothetical protein